MGFKIASLGDLTFQHPVKIAGAEFTAEFRVLDDDRLKALADDGDLPFIQAVLKRWDGVEGDDGRPVALDYDAAWAGLRMAGIAVDRELFEGLRVCERAAIETIAATREATPAPDRPAPAR